MYFLSIGYAPVVRWLGEGEGGLSSLESDVAAIGYTGAVACAAVCTLLSGLRAEARAPRGPKPEDRVADWAVLAVAMGATGALATWFLSVGISNVFASSYVNTYKEAQGYGFLLAGWDTLSFTACYGLVRVLDLRQQGLRPPRILYIMIAVAGSMVVINTVLGRRGPLVYMLLTLTVLAHAKGARIYRLFVVVGAAAALLDSAFVEGARTKLGSGLDNEVQAGVTLMSRKRSIWDVEEFNSIFGNLQIIVAEQPIYSLIRGRAG